VAWREAPVLRAPKQLATTSPTIRYQDVHYVYILRSDAKARELFLKSGSGKRFIHKQLGRYFSSAK
jgi:hypothetical protein